MMFPAICEITADIIVIAQPTSSSSGFDFTTLLPPLLGVLIGGLVSSATSFFLNNRSNKQQLMRDEAEYQRQIERERIAYDRQIEREQAAYKRSLKDAKRECVRSAYKVILNVADKFQYEAHVMKIFFDMRRAFNDFSVKLSTHLIRYGYLKRSGNSDRKARGTDSLYAEASQRIGVLISLLHQPFPSFDLVPQ